MPHDKNGSLIEPGDIIKTPALNPHSHGCRGFIVGPVLTVNEGDQSCSGRLAFITQYAGIQTDYFHAGDAEIIHKQSKEN